nr:unnamed protein product [Callosobruchus analis]
MVTPAAVATLSELFDRSADSSKDNMILERLKALAVQHTYLQDGKNGHLQQQTETMFSRTPLIHKF